jgi:hypothetical protein
MLTKIGDSVRPCFPAHRDETHPGTLRVRARLGNVFLVDSVSAQPEPNGAVRIGGQVWVKSWVKVTP